ncbi:hypothetical protein DAPPUDRAFT_327546 [Daphnia pulex]|uniref:Uncharacterized protein n=1 Tax=Daphnia pulex TaxID=6669 RepID=E9HB61_DAPPU|nr:hypothetical protein DAPPUDRAFT_327546 [Daphnia pulex]|eukprot:EFX71067.1 hypothetical protein DAPPUDRAFT_327546 [Daphnia pulex]
MYPTENHQVVVIVKVITLLRVLNSSSTQLLIHGHTIVPCSSKHTLQYQTKPFRMINTLQGPHQIIGTLHSPELLNRYLTEIGRVVNTVPETPLLTQNLQSNTADTVSPLPGRDLPSLESTQQTKKRHRHPEQESFELSVLSP